MTGCVGLLPLQEARASDWQTVADRPDGQIVTMLDVNSIKNRNGTLTAWLRVSYSSDQTGVPGETYRSSLQLWAFDCRGERRALMQATGYDGPDATGKAVATHIFTLDSNNSWQHVEPNSVGEASLKLVCTHLPSESR
jgi:hypothetical protein